MGGTHKKFQDRQTSCWIRHSNKLSGIFTNEIDLKSLRISCNLPICSDFPMSSLTFYPKDGNSFCSSLVIFSSLSVSLT